MEGLERLESQGLLTWTAVFLEIVLGGPVSRDGIKSLLHLRPREDDGGLVGVDVGGGIAGILIMLDKVDGEVSEVGQVEAVEPDHGTGAVLAVVVPVPGRRQDHVASLHGDAFAVHRGEAALALDDEPHGEGGVSMCLGRFVGHHQLQSGVECVGGEGSVCVEGAGCELVECMCWVGDGEEENGLEQCWVGDLIKDSPRAGLTSIKTRRSAWASVMISPALRRLGRTSS